MGYDFSRPDPGEILPNPTEGVGTPPQLRAYVTVKDMASKDRPASKAPTASQETEKPADAEPMAPAAPTAAAQPPESNPAVVDPDAWRSSPTARTARHLETTLAQQVAALGLDGPFIFKPSPAAQADPKIAASEKRAWNHMVDSLAVSWRSWQTAHAGGAPQRAGELPPTQTGGLQPDLTASGSTPRTAPGEIILKGANPSVIGDLSDIAPR